MKSRGIRISDLKTNGALSVTLTDILKEIENGELYKWSILDLYSIGYLENDKSLPDFEQQISEADNGLFISWKDLNNLSLKFYQIYDITLISCLNKNLIRRYKNDQEMHETCDIVINMIDSCYWKVFSKDENLITRLTEKFKDVKFLEPDFER